MRCIEKANQEEKEEEGERANQEEEGCVTANLFPTLHPCFPLPHYFLLGSRR